MKRLRERARIAGLLGLLAWVGLAEALPLAHVVLHGELSPHVHQGAAPAPGTAGVESPAARAPQRRRAARCHTDAEEGAHCHARAGAAALPMPGPDDRRERVGPLWASHGDGSFEHHAAGLLRPLALAAPLGLLPRARLPAPITAPALVTVALRHTARARGPPAPISSSSPPSA